MRAVAETNRSYWLNWELIFFSLLGGVSIARSRRHIENFYADEIDRIGEVSRTTETGKSSSIHRPGTVFSLINIWRTR